MEILRDTLHDTFLMLPFLFIMYLIIEYFEHHNNIDKLTFKLTQWGPLYGALLGVIPQCGFSVIAAVLFADKKITLGTLIAIFIATSDEAIPILIANQNLLEPIFILIISKIILAIIVGYVCDFIFDKKIKHRYGSMNQKKHDHSFFLNALFRTFKIYAFIFVINLILLYTIEYITMEKLSSIVLKNAMIQPLYATLFGFIPNCASSVILTQLYAKGLLSFASLFAGLITNAGLGIVILLQHKVPITTILKICCILILSALLAGYAFMLLNFG